MSSLKIIDNIPPPPSFIKAGFIKRGRQKLKILKSVQIGEDTGLFSICRHEGTKKIYLHRYAARGKINNFLENYEFIDKDYRSSLVPLTLEKAHEIMERIESNDPYSSVFIFYEKEATECEAFDRVQSEQEHQYTSTGIKFWRHQEQMLSYREEAGATVISTHISPEGACPLKCPYCSVTYRDTHSRIELDVIKDYVEKLQTRGLKAVILTGGGEPTAYKQFNELVQWLKYERGLSVALITNGTLGKRIEAKTLKAFSWVRVSINIFDNWETRIGDNFDIDELSDDCVVGCSMVYTVEHESTDNETTDRVEMLRKVAKIADRFNAKYVRLLPNCLLEQRHLISQHKALDHTLEQLGDTRFFHQYKVHGAPSTPVCHQSYFRPYLSEEPYHTDGTPGTVYPCDSVVLNDSFQHFAEEYQLCKAGDILDFLDRVIKPNFDPRERCKGCVFTDNVNMLGEWKDGKIDKFDNYPSPLGHEEFV